MNSYCKAFSNPVNSACTIVQPPNALSLLPVPFSFSLSFLQLLDEFWKVESPFQWLPAMQRSGSKRTRVIRRSGSFCPQLFFSASFPAIPHQQRDLPTLARTSHGLWHFFARLFSLTGMSFSPSLPGQVTYLSLRLSSNAITSPEHLLIVRSHLHSPPKHCGYFSHYFLV